MYLTPSVFFSQYVARGEIGAGAYGSVKETRSGHAVKSTNDLKSFIREVNYYSSISHPCIMRLEAWTYSGDKGYIALPKGIDSYTAFENGLISLNEIMADVLSGLDFLYTQNICHCDIKPENIVYYDGKAKIIDFGLAKNSKNFDDGRKYVQGVGYTYLYRYPEWVESEVWNPVEADLYALGRSLFAYLDSKTRRLFTFRTGDPEIDVFIEQVTVTRDKIKSTPEIVSQTPVYRQWEGFRLETLPIQPDDDCGSKTIIVFDWLFEVAAKYEMRAKTFFLSLHLFHRVAGIILPDYAVARDQWLQLQLLGACCLYLAAVVEEDTRGYDFANMVVIGNGAFNEAECFDMTIRIMATAEGIIQTPTYWDVAESKEDLVLLLDDTFNCNYTSERARELTGIVNNKNVLARDLYRLYAGKPLKTTDQAWEPIPVLDGPVVYHPIHGNPKPRSSLEKLMYGISILRANEKSLYNTMGLILTNRQYLTSLDKDNARYLYSVWYSLINQGGYDLLYLTIPFNFEMVIPGIFNRTLFNPFSISCREITQLVRNSCPKLPPNFVYPSGDSGVILVSPGGEIIDDIF